MTKKQRICLKRRECILTIILSTPQSTDLEASLQELECHFTWDFKKDEIKDLDNISEKLLDRVKFCHNRYHSTYFNILAFLSHLEGQNETALEFLSKAECVLRNEKPFLEKHLLVTYGNYAWVYYHIGKLSEVNTYLGKVEDICRSIPRSLRYSANLPIVYGEKAWTLLKLGARYYPSSKESFQKALHGDPDNLSLNNGYAVVLYRLEGLRRRKVKTECSDAVKQIRKVLRLEPNNSEAMVFLALKLQWYRKEESRKLVENALRVSPDVPQVTRYVAKYFRAEGDIDKSLEILKKAVELAPQSSFLHHQIGLCYKQELAKMKINEQQVPLDEKMAKMAECIHHFKKSVELKPSNLHAKVNLAEAYGENRQMEEAEKIFTDVLEDPFLGISDRQYVLANYALFLLFKKKNESSAICHFKAAYEIQLRTSSRVQAGKNLNKIANQRLKTNTEDSEAYEIISFVYMQDGLKKKAMEYSLKAKQFSSFNAEDLSALCDEKLNI
ncbi:Interferon-induced protein with tetratricopeptide repeats 5 [Acipenser ruthenus]|uniref:Interferon-induced protein with tetratricopeptide repeats 5 n=1 Tax=Acipenser ruthenus TaxID=7906 RepID=A0A444UAH1_ACIRT|nr:Interferon-induced protein with tetratricopeptide repeats 5 [Acipenser ruthenus]